MVFFPAASYFFIIWAIGRGCHAAEFNEAFAASVFANIDQLIAEPWTRVNSILFSAFQNKWSYVYTGDNIQTTSGPDGFVQYVDTNNTMQYIWSIFKPFEYEDSSLISMVYYGFENGMFIAYAEPTPGKLYFEPNGNNSCPDWNITSHCREYYGGNSTNPITGRKAGRITEASYYDPRWRPWYIDSMAGGSIWTAPYVYAEGGGSVVGITAAQQIITNNGEVIGVIGTGYNQIFFIGNWVLLT
jgi:hypothetical protein